MIAEDLSESGDLVDAYLNYKEGLTHLIAALQCKHGFWPSYLNPKVLPHITLDSNFS